MDLLPGSWNGTMMECLGIEVAEASAERVIVTMPVDARTRQPAGMLHGGASAALAETAASLGAALNVRRQTDEVAGIELTASHVRSVRSGRVTATAAPLHRGRRTQVWDVRIVDDAGRLVCAARCTLAMVVNERTEVERTGVPSELPSVD